VGDTKATFNKQANSSQGEWGNKKKKKKKRETFVNPTATSHSFRDILIQIPEIPPYENNPQER